MADIWCLVTGRSNEKNNESKLQGVPTQTFILHFALADKNIWIEGVLGILSSGIFTYEPWIWSKVTSLSSTASNSKGAKNQ